jgi:transposase
MCAFQEFAAMIGIDWADKKHDLCLQVRGEAELEHSTLSHTPETIEAWASTLRARFAGQPVGICIESRKVPLIHALLKYDFLTLFPVNPQTLARYRRALRPSRAKDDPTDAQLLLKLVRRHSEQFTAWRPESAELRALAQMVELRRRLVADKVRITNRLTASLKLFFPQVLDWFADKDTLIFCEFLERFPDLPSAKKARRDVLLRFFRGHNARYSEANHRRIEAIKNAVSLTDDPGVVDPNRLFVQILIKQLALTLGAIRRFDQTIAEQFTTMADANLF